MRHRFLLASFIALLASCGSAPPTPPGVEPPVILEVLAPEPALEGSVLEVRVLGGEVLGRSPRLAVERLGSVVDELPTLPGSADGTLWFELSSAVVEELGGGIHPLDVRLRGEVDSEPFGIELRLVRSLPVDLFEVPSGQVFRNEVAVVNGAGIVTATEGTVTARFVGSYLRDAGGAAMPIDVALPVAPLERRDRERGVVVLTTDLGGLAPGTFDGTIQLESVLRSGERTQSAALSTTLHFNPPALFGLAPTEASLGQILVVRGGGFVGGPDRPSETTLLRLQGTFTPAGGGAPEPFGPVELVPRFVSGSEVELEVELELRGDRLVSTLFGHARGRFQGTATPITLAGSGASRMEVAGDTVPFTFSLVALRQVVHVRFLPGFYDSLRRFGLASAAPEVIARVLERMQSIYLAWNVDLRLEEPDDFSRAAYSVLEIGGPDPNGRGLFGYDNTPGKDVGNLRLFDALGGANAETQSDGYPGYGGVFVESFLYWSSHPELPGEPPPSAPDPDPLFDEVFDPVRTQPATRAEAGGNGDPERVAAVRRAIHALGSIIGETASHELGHSFGLAQPYGSPTAYHNDFDGDGCLMDAGGDRPLGERMEISGFAPTQFCYDEPAYLFEILGR